MALLAGQINGERNKVREPQPFLDRLEGLAAELGRRGLRTRLNRPLGRVPSLHVVNPSLSRMAEDVYVGRSRNGAWWFWWPWAERIASADNAGQAADLIAKVLDAGE